MKKETNKHDMNAKDQNKTSSACKLSPHYEEKAIRELNETPQTRFKGLKILRDLIAYKNLNTRTDDEFLLRFLRAKKFDTQKAAHVLERYCRMKNDHPELYQALDVSHRMRVFLLQAQTMLASRDPSGSRVFLFRVSHIPLNNIQVKSVTLEDVFCTNMLALEWSVQEPETQVAGLRVIVDLKGFNLSKHAGYLSPYYAKVTTDMVQETFPLRFKGFHILNQPAYFNAMFAVLKPFLKEKIKQRFHLHGKDLESLYKYVPKEILPQEYGGTQGIFDNTSWRKNLAECLPNIIGPENLILEDERLPWNIPLEN